MTTVKIQLHCIYRLFPKLILFCFPPSLHSLCSFKSPKRHKPLPNTQNYCLFGKISVVLFLPTVLGIDRSEPQLTLTGQLTATSVTPVMITSSVAPQHRQKQCCFREQRYVHCCWDKCTVAWSSLQYMWHYKWKHSFMNFPYGNT